MRKIILALAAALALLLLVSFPPWGTALSQQPAEVLVTNLPNILRVQGEVTVVRPVRHAETVRRLDLIVPSVPRDATTDLIEVESVATEGFTAVTLSLHGEVRGRTLADGAVGAVLVPDEIAVLEMLNEKGVLHFPVEVAAGVGAKGVTHFSAQVTADLGFPRYKVYLYNSTDRTADVDLYLYLTH